MHRVLKAYGTIDKQAAECSVGYNYIVALLLKFIQPDSETKEEYVFWCLMSVMQGLNWRRFFLPQSVYKLQLQD